MGPAGSGKSTLVSTLINHGVVTKRTISAVNLDPAAEHFDYSPVLDIRDFIQVEDAMEDPELRYGPNGGLVFCLEYLVENIDWLKNELGCDENESDYLVLDCPGQIELYTHMNVMRRLTDALSSWGFRVAGVFLIDANFMVDGGKFVSGSMAALSTMVNLEIPHINVLSKLDLLSHASRKQLDRFLDMDTHELTEDAMGRFGEKYYRLSQSLGKVIEDYSLVRYFPLDITDEESISDLVLMLDNVLQYGEDEEVKTTDFETPEENEEELTPS
ncbi:GPN [Lepeophtheirus salmonis]|uniref:GPN-loop GTPase 3 n=1 Tax=Lepeophtheirus salmonis TaxID=72036 RepID=A0A7R8CFP6_LEPSM|nr:GPN [Lepeophtheirus salmonis]CAF2808354.1 GPN [Lepeophtheirus salmonis]